MVEIKIGGNVPKEDRIKLYKHILNVFLIIFVIFIIFILVRSILIYKPEIVREVCPEKIVYQNFTKEILKYVCENGTIVDTSQDCKKQEEQLPELKPIFTNENGTLIEEVLVETACVSGFRGGYIYYQVSSPADNVSYQVKPEGGTYQDMLKTKGYLNSYKYFVICTPPYCPKRGDFSLEVNKRYLLRIKFDRQRLYNKTEYSNEHIVDLTPNSEYMIKWC